MRVGLVRRRRGTGVVALDNVERVDCLDPVQLDRQYLRQGRPVILTGLFDGAPIRRLAGVADVKSVLRKVTLSFGPNPVHAAVLDQARLPERRARFGRLYDRFARGALPGHICAEHELPDELGALIPALPHLQLGDPADRVEANIFFSGAGNATHLHYDKDLRHDLIYHVVGRKRYVLIDPTETHKLAAGTAPGAPYASGLFLDRFTPQDLLAFIRHTGAWDCVLSPGETLVLPATMWHYVAYVDTALSVHLRLARNRPLLRLAHAASDAEVGTVELQALAAALLDETRIAPAVARALDDLEDLVTDGPHDLLALHDAFQARCVEACRRLGDVPGLQRAAPP